MGCGFAPALNIGRKFPPFGLRCQDKGGEAWAWCDGFADSVVLFDGNVEKRLSSLTAVGQGEEFVSDFNVLFDLLSEGCAFFSEL